LRFAHASTSVCPIVYRWCEARLGRTRYSRPGDRCRTRLIKLLPGNPPPRHPRDTGSAPDHVNALLRTATSRAVTSRSLGKPTLKTEPVVRTRIPSPKRRSSRSPTAPSDSIAWMFSREFRHSITTIRTVIRRSGRSWLTEGGNDLMVRECGAWLNHPQGI